MTKRDKNILIVEDEIIIADDISRVVTDLGFTPLAPAFSYSQATNLFIEFEPDLVILDVKLKGELTGFDFAEWLREEYQTPIIYLTIFGDLASKRMAQRTLSESYLEKPFIDRELKDVISQALDFKNEP